MREAEQLWADCISGVRDAASWDATGFEDIIGDGPLLKLAIARVHEVASAEESNTS